jgi:hypothetical protein
VFLVFGISHRFQIFLVAGCAPYILGRCAALAGDTAQVLLIGFRSGKTIASSSKS